MYKNQASQVIPAVVTIREAVKRAEQDGMAVSEHALRNWIRQGVLPVRRSGNRSLLYYPNLLEFLSFREIKEFHPTAEHAKHSLQKTESI